MSRLADALGETGSVKSVEFSPDGKFIVSGTKYDNSVVMWRTSDGLAAGHGIKLKYLI